MRIGLTMGITEWHVRVLCDNPWEGGGGFLPNEVGDMTLDQILMLFCKRDHLLNRKQRMDPMAAMSMTSKDGTLRGRAGDGTLIKGRIAGKSKARQIRERLEAEKKAKETEKSRRRRRK